MWVRLRMRRLVCGAGLVILMAMSWSPAAPASMNSPVERGRYLAIAGNCVACHTKPGGRAYAGGLKFETPFGVLYSTNITPDRATGIGGWSLSQFSVALRSGTRPNGEHLYPVFPYSAYTKLSDADVAALYAYLQSLQPVSQRSSANQMRFPFGQRRLWGRGNSCSLPKRVLFSSQSEAPSGIGGRIWSKLWATAVLAIARAMPWAPRMRIFR